MALKLSDYKKLHAEAINISPDAPDDKVLDAHRAYMLQAGRPDTASRAIAAREKGTSAALANEKANSASRERCRQLQKLVSLKMAESPRATYDQAFSVVRAENPGLIGK